ncbi:MAG: hypothetical protein ACWA5W_04215 [Phycisphaerales bacterium]
MKLKGVNPFEQHIEKIVLGIMFLLLLAVLSIQFVTRPNDIDVGGRTVPPDQVYSVLEDKANQLQSQMADQNPVLPQIAQVDLVERYNEAFANASGSQLALSAPLGQGVDITSAIGAVVIAPSQSDGPVSALLVPKTSQPIAVSQWATLDPYAVLQVPEFESFIPATQPYDFTSVSIQASFSGKALEASLLGQGDEANAIPRRFWSATGLSLLGFEAERQKLLPDGSWGASEPIQVPPHTPMPTQAMGEEDGLLELSNLVTTARGVEDDIARPMFLPTIAGPVWAPPSERVEIVDDSDDAKIQRLKKQLDRAIADLDKMRNGPGPSAQPGNTRPGGGKTGGGGRGRGTRPGPGSIPATRPNKRLMDQLETKIEKMRKQLEDLGYEDIPASGAPQRGQANQRPPLLEQESIDLWVHDLGVEPGAIYRYRTRVVVNNPLFRKSSELDPDDEQQQALTLDPFARGGWSDWSDDVAVGAKQYYFVANAKGGSGGISGSQPKATIELYKVFYGHYRRSTLNVAPGDKLSAAVRMSGDLLHFDTSVIGVDEAAKAIQAHAEDDSTDWPEGISELTNRMSINIGDYLLDIYTGQASQSTNFGQQVTPMEVVLRDTDGTIVVRSDLGDKSSLAYALASESASQASSTGIRAPGAPAISPAAALFEPTEP